MGCDIKFSVSKQKEKTNDSNEDKDKKSNEDKIKIDGSEIEI